MQPFGHNKKGPEIGDLRPLLGERSWVPILHSVAWTKTHLHAKCHLDPSSRLATIDIGRKLGSGAPPPFWGGGMGSPPNIKSPEPRPISIPSGIFIHPAIWPQQIWAENWGLCPPFWGGEAGSLSNTVWPGPRPTCVPSFILIRLATVHQPHRQDRTGQTDGRRSDSIIKANCFKNGRPIIAKLGF